MTSFVGISTIFLLGLGLWLMLPRGKTDRFYSKLLGALFGCISLVLFAWGNGHRHQIENYSVLRATEHGHIHGLVEPKTTDNYGHSHTVYLDQEDKRNGVTEYVGTVHLGWDPGFVFYLMAAIAVISAAAAITFRNPVYCAIWFGMSLLATAGLFLIQDAQFLAVATVVVYAGAILVTFLFVLMLAQPGGHALYDRVSWEALLSAFTGAAILGALSANLFLGHESRVDYFSQQSTQDEKFVPPKNKVLDEHHMARLGGELFSRHLIAVEVAGTLLMVALVGAIAIVAQGRQSGAGGKQEDQTHG